MNREKAEQLKAEYWDDVCAVLDEWIGKALNQLRYTSPDKLQALQERVNALESVKGLPDRVIESSTPTGEVNGN